MSRDRSVSLEDRLASVGIGDIDTSRRGIAEANRHFASFSRTFYGRDKGGTEFVGGDKPYLFARASAKLDLNASAVDTQGYLQSIMYAAPANRANDAIRENNERRSSQGSSTIPLTNSCVCSTPGCRKACLSGAGNLGLHAGTHALNIRTAFASSHPDHFLTVLHGQIGTFQRRAERLGVKPVIRLNGTTDIRFDELPTADILFRDFGRNKIQYNEYTKHNTRGALSAADLEQENARFARTPNLYAIHSLNELTTPGRVRQLAEHGRNFAVPVDVEESHPVFNEHRSALMPRTTFVFGDDEYPTVNGYRHDMRFLDPQGGHAVILPVKKLTGGREQVETGNEEFIRGISSLRYGGAPLSTPVQVRGSRTSRR